MVEQNEITSSTVTNVVEQNNNSETIRKDDESPTKSVTTTTTSDLTDNDIKRNEELDEVISTRSHTNDKATSLDMKKTVQRSQSRYKIPIIFIIAFGLIVAGFIIGVVLFLGNDSKGSSNNSEQLVSSNGKNNITSTSSNSGQNNAINDTAVDGKEATNVTKTSRPIMAKTTNPTRSPTVVDVVAETMVPTETIVLPSPPSTISITPIYINAGGGSVVTTSSNNSTIAWSEDMYYIGGRDGRHTNCPDQSVSNEDISCTYRIFRNSDTTGNKTYTIPLIAQNSTIVTDGTTINVTVRLYFVEIYFTESNQRVFDVLVEGIPVLVNFDIYQSSATIANNDSFKNTNSILTTTSSTSTDNSIIVVAETTIPVIDGLVSIEFQPITSLPIISAIEVVTGLTTTTTDSTTDDSGTIDSNTTTITITVPSNETIDSNTTTTTDNITVTIPSNDTTGTATYSPGLLNTQEAGLLLSEGLTAKIIATSGKSVLYHNGDVSNETFHYDPDAGATYIDPRPNNVGGWIYVSNSEVRPKNGVRNKGGVGSITFNKDGNIIEYKRLLNGTTSNCGGGKTPWNTWISCEEWGRGEIYQVDPLGIRTSSKITMGSINPGLFEAFAYDVRDTTKPHFFVTKDDTDGELTRFTPTTVDWNDPWTMLESDGTIEYLVVTPDSTDDTQGTYTWTTDLSVGQATAKQYFQNNEGIDVYENQLFFVTKKFKLMFVLDLDSNTYRKYKTSSGLFDGQPDQIVRLTSNNNSTTATITEGTDDSNFVYFTEDGGNVAGVHARNTLGQYFTVFESLDNGIYADETTGLAFSPNGLHMYIAYQDNGLLFDITRIDGLPFYGKTLNVKYHSLSTNSM